MHPNDHVNAGQSSNDVIPTAVHIGGLLAILVLMLLLGTDAHLELLDALGDPVDAPQIVGQSVVKSDLSDGIRGDGLGEWEITVEPLTDGVYNMNVEVEDHAGNISETSELLQIEIDTDRDNFMSAMEAKEYGLVDHVVDSE